MTRAKEQAGRLAALLAARGARVLLAPLLRIEPPPDRGPLALAAGRAGAYDWICFTSANAVERFLALLDNPRRLDGVQLAAVGEATRQALERRGLTAHLVPERQTAAALGEALAARLRPGARVLFPRSEIAGRDLPDALRSAGAAVEEVVAYRTVLEEAGAAVLKQALEEGRVDYVTLTSPSAVTGLREALGGARLAARAVCIGPQTEKAARAAGFAVAAVAAAATPEALVEALVADAQREETDQ